MARVATRRTDSRRSPATLSGGGNVAVGAHALTADTIGYGNTAIGGYVMENNTNGFENTATGTFVLRNNTFGAFNTAKEHFGLVAEEVAAVYPELMSCSGSATRSSKFFTASNWS